jgi:hypothetical protein
VVIAGRVVGRGGGALMRPVVSQGRALPLAWQVRQGKQGHCPEDLQSALVEPGSALRPAGARVLVLGDGALDGTRLQDTGQEDCWSSVVRTGSHIPVVWDGDSCRCETVAACITPGPLGALREVRMTEAAYGPMMLLCGWAQGDRAPLYVVPHMASAAQACRV